MNELALRVAARFQLANARKDTAELVTPINKPKGISKGTLNDQAVTQDSRDDETSPAKSDLRPEDIFSPKPKNMNVLDYVRKGWPGVDADYTDMEKAIRKQIPKDKGYSTVKNLSQYLVETKGGGGTKPVG